MIVVLACDHGTCASLGKRNQYGTIRVELVLYYDDTHTGASYERLLIAS